MSGELRRFDHLRGALVLVAGCCMLILGMPGLDLLGPKRFAEGSAERKEVLEHPWGPVTVFFADANRMVREPIVGVLAPLQRPLRLAQSWGLYGGGPNKVRRLEVYVDDTLVFRSNDPEATWLRAPIRYRRIRPVVDAHCVGKSNNSVGLVSFLLRRAREDFPDAKHVRIQCTEERPTKNRDFKVKMVREASAPDWEVQS